MTRAPVLLIVAMSSWAVPAFAQKVQIVVIEAKHGRPIKDECLNVSLGSFRGADLLIATDENGIATMKFNSGQVSVISVPGKTCNGMASTAAISIAALPERISVVTDYYVSCQYSNKLVKDPTWLKADPAQRIPSFSLADVLLTGVVAANSCTPLKMEPTPGQIKLVVRKPTFWEGMKS